MSLAILIASYLEPESVERIRAAVPDAEILYDPALVGPPRYKADHTGPPEFQRTPEGEERFRSWLARAEVMFDFDRHLAPELPRLAPRLRWIQSTSSGIGPFVKKSGLDKSGITITNAAGIHAVPLAEHTLLSMLYFTKEVPRLRAEQAARLWQRYCGRELRGRAVGVVGLGKVGQEVARLCRAVGLRVLGVKRTEGPSAESLNCDELYTQRDLHQVLPKCDFLVLICPHTPETEGMMGEREFALLPPGAVLINIGRGALVREEALIAALRSGHLGGAALDVMAEEPPASENPLWEMPNVLITAHSASTVEQENARLTELFCANLQRYQAGEPLLNLFQS